VSSLKHELSDIETFKRTGLEKTPCPKNPIRIFILEILGYLLGDRKVPNCLDADDLSSICWNKIFDMIL